MRNSPSIIARDSRSQLWATIGGRPWFTSFNMRKLLPSGTRTRSNDRQETFLRLARDGLLPLRVPRLERDGLRLRRVRELVLLATLGRE